jgi:hypothetical protein
MPMPPPLPPPMLMPAPPPPPAPPLAPAGAAAPAGPDPWDERERIIKEKWWAITSGAILLSVNYSLMAMIAATGDIGPRGTDEPPPDLTALYVPVAGPLIAMINGDVKFSDAGPIPLFCGLFQGLGIAGIIVGLAMPIPPRPAVPRAGSEPAITAITARGAF